MSLLENAALDERPADPPNRRPRVTALDVARALAICGMVMVHFALVMGGKGTATGWPAWVLRALDGRPAAMFVILAGVGVTLRTAGAAHDAAATCHQRRILFRRGVFLLVAGFVNLLIWPGDILRVYGVSLILAAALPGVRDRWLLTLAAAFVVGFILLLGTIDYDTYWDWSTLHYRDLWTSDGAFRNLFYDGFRAVFPWTGLLLFGMWLGRRDLNSPSAWRRMLAWGVGIATTTELASVLVVRQWVSHPRGLDAPTIRALAGTESMPPLPMFLLAAGAAAVAAIALCGFVTLRWPANGAVRALADTGRMAFTWYVAHIVLGLGFVVAMGWDERFSTATGLGLGFLFFVLAVGVSMIWKRRWRHGPLEWLLRKVAG